MAFAIRRFLKDFAPSATAAAEVLGEYGFAQPTRRAVWQWGDRGSIPSTYLVAILFIRELEQRPARISDYMKGE